MLKCIINPFILPCYFILIYILCYEERWVVKLCFFFFSLNIYSAWKRWVRIKLQNTDATRLNLYCKVVYIFFLPFYYKSTFDSWFMDIEIIDYRYSHVTAKRSIFQILFVWWNCRWSAPRPQEIARDRTELTSVQVHRHSGASLRSRGRGLDERQGSVSLSLSVSFSAPRGEEKQAFLHEFRSKIHNDTKVEEVDITKIVPTSRVRFASAVAGLDRPSTLYFSDSPSGSYPTCELLQSVAVPGYRQ